MFERIRVRRKFYGDSALKSPIDVIDARARFFLGEKLSRDVGKLGNIAELNSLSLAVMRDLENVIYRAVGRVLRDCFGGDK